PYLTPPSLFHSPFGLQMKLAITALVGTLETLHWIVGVRLLVGLRPIPREEQKKPKWRELKMNKLTLAYVLKVTAQGCDLLKPDESDAPADKLNPETFELLWTGDDDTADWKANDSDSISLMSRDWYVYSVNIRSILGTAVFQALAVLAQ
ncbi:hypothetical protein STEG23_023482, partial [Scotinomys teguina]